MSLAKGLGKTGVHLAGLLVDARHLVLGGDRFHFVVVVAQRLEVAEGDEAQRVAGLADFVIDLEAALQLPLVELAEGAVAGQRKLLGVQVKLVLGGRGYAFLGKVYRADDQRPGERAREEQSDEDGEDADHMSVFPSRWIKQPYRARLSRHGRGQPR